MKYTPANSRIAVIGAGNIGTQFACICAAKGYPVHICSSKPELFDGSLEVVDEYGNITCGVPSLISSDIGKVVEGCNIIFVAKPAFLLKISADQLLPYIHNTTKICVLPGTGGAEFTFSSCIHKGATLYGLQRVPTVARLEQYGKRVRCEGLRSDLFLASIPGLGAKDFAAFLSSLWGIPCHILPNYLSVTLTPSNPILHTSRLRTLFSDYVDGKIYERNPLFYGEWSDESSALLIACDNELQHMLKIMDKLDLHDVRSLKKHYDSYTISEMTKKISSIQSLCHLKSPMKRVSNGWIPDFQSRFFSADFPFGLAIIAEFSRIIGANTPNIDSTLKWYSEVTGDNRRFNLDEYGIHTLEDIYSFYLPNERH